MSASWASSSASGAARPGFTAEDARIRVGTALALLELAAQALEELPPPEAAFLPGDRDLYRYLQAADAAESWLVGHEPGATLERPGNPSALGDGRRIYAWDDEETERHFQSAVRHWSDGV